MSYPRHSSDDSVAPSPKFPAIEEQVLSYWKADGTFQASIDQREGADEWVFYDGPPFANGLPHYGHLLTGYAKDLFPRYQTMRGKQVHRRFGWDTHGLPAELEAMRQLGITEKSQIEEMGIDKFNAAARESVLKYTGEWQEYVTRMARWVDFENDYKTLDVNFMESVIWAFKQLHTKDLAYEGFRVLPYCWNDETPLSNHELRMDDDVYKMRQDQTVTVTFPLDGVKAEALGLTGVKALAWTTTPWTLPTNLALAVGPDIDYAILPAGPLGAGDGSEQGSAQFMLAGDTIAAYAKELGYETAEEALAAVTRTIKGAELAGVRYDRLWDFYADAETYGTENAWQFLVADYVATGEGTGIVHQAPAYGEDDQNVCAAAGIPVVISVDDGGKFLPSVPPVEGMQVFDANKPLTKLLREEGRLLKVASYEHSYPHCWRCRNPLIYKAVSSWFVKVPEFRDRMGELNQQINWVPENVKEGQFGKWVSNARDWSISRNRYWGSPIPIWKSDNPDFPRVDVYGSLAEIQADFGRLPLNHEGEPDLHRPFIDELTRPNPDDPSGQSTMRRIEDVLDVWFDSGSMPFAQVHYPFENQEWFDTHSPADFIVEYIGQTRGWFYTLHTLSTALFDRPAFSNVISHGIVLGNDGQKMSKSLRNYPDVSEVFERDGADAMRWFLMSSSVIRGGNLMVTEEGIRDGVRQMLLPLWSTYYFFTLYANAADNYEASWRTDSTHVLDRYLLAKTRELIEDVTVELDALDSPMAAAKLRDFADVLTNWYVRRSRDRFWSGDDKDAFDTLYTVLETVARVAAPLLPLVSEEMWRGLTNGRSVHLTDWPDASAFPADHDLVATMDRVREIASSGLALRKARSLRVRLPLASLTVVSDTPAALAPFSDILRDELNVKAVKFDALEEGSLESFGITKKLTVNARALGPRVGKQVQQVIKEAKAGNWETTADGVSVDGMPLEAGEYELQMEAADEASAIAFLSEGGFVIIDTQLTPELSAEGLARDVIRAIQDARKAAGFDVSDRISLTIGALDPADHEAIGFHSAMISSETLAAQSTVQAFANDLEEGTLEVHRTQLAAGKYANIGALVIDITKMGTTNV
ncbi:isoleucine--tRNA ligase [Salinibacterium sp. NSLL150]|uniref:isoleucine--tRNA ligase n=1 Tax=unclassified Salinibacterium TaxID=2632331 RepID=UPI0018CF6A31|nr:MULTISPECIES: isoleucine--tRNA ligase [unclassified Salinibacterium]MBH0098851.1 isoleucine--tRNA ligase [Salinibacterium sp. NSLL35]MBH0101606.1 isoleucine--tRNA ligase [Salinibacterium sp. NSLL150]MBH0104365.1 isoleucine--tRNA ligase [Salinibacterium sp. NSLL16]MBH0107126.1 isoleucine--tRNA ligase [Salinibacterium sp. NSLL17]